MRRPRLLSCALVALTATATPRVAAAGPTVIRDEMLRDTAITPVLGRGYSIATNTYQSICLVNVVKTRPSYNFNFLFQEMREDGTVARTSSSTSATTAGGGTWFATFSTEARTRRDETTKLTWVRHHMLVTILIDVYYSSIDEAQSKMSPAAASLLTAQDLPGFFDACGMYYVRSISRQAALVSRFTYESTSTERDTAFEQSLKTSLAGFSLVGGAGGTRATDRTETESRKFSATNLTIQTVGLGLGKKESVDLVSYDLDTFRNAVKGAFAAAQPEDVGRVTAIEVAPWVENTEFQTLNKLVPIQVPERDENGKVVMEPDPDPAKPPRKKMRTVLPYAQKRTLTQNSEFLAEADRAARAKLNAYYKAKQCRTAIEVDHMVQRDGGQWEFMDSDDGVSDGDLTVVNNRSGREPQALRWLYGILSDTYLALLWMEYDAFIYGGSGPAVPAAEQSPVERARIAREFLSGQKPPPYPRNVFPGATRCLTDLVDAGMTVTSYREVATCERLEEMFSVVSGRAVDDYCMPTIAPTQRQSP
jgi:hypothetical protein